MTFIFQVIPGIILFVIIISVCFNVFLKKRGEESPHTVERQALTETRTINPTSISATTTMTINPIYFDKSREA